MTVVPNQCVAAAAAAAATAAVGSVATSLDCSHSLRPGTHCGDVSLMSATAAADHHD